MENMGDSNEQTIIISDLLSFVACKIKIANKDNILRALKQYYSEKDIIEAHRTLLASISNKKSVRALESKNSDPLYVIYKYFEIVPEEELPVFVCKNLNNVPELDIIKSEILDDCIVETIQDEGEDEKGVGVERKLREEQKTMKSQIADIAYVVKQLKDQLENISHINYPKSYDSITQIKKKRKDHTEILPSKKQNYSVDCGRSEDVDSSLKKDNLDFLQSLIDEDGNQSEGDQYESVEVSEIKDFSKFMDPEYDDEQVKESETSFCEVILKEEPEDIEESVDENHPEVQNRDIFLVSPSKAEHIVKHWDEDDSKAVGQKVIYLKNNEGQDLLVEEENSIEITPSYDFLGNFEESDPLSRIGTLDSIITISKNTTSESIIIEKIEATNGEGYYYKCQRCEFICNEEKMILKHECNSLTVDVKNRKPRRRNKVNSPDMFMCNICDAYVIDVAEFNEHMMDHYNIIRSSGEYECLLCALSMDNYIDYRTHLLEHSWKIPYSCNICDYRSTKEMRMRSHALKHLECKGPNHFECLICGKICGTRNALEKHKQRHKKNYDFKCEICGLTFRHRSALSQHTLNHTKVRMFVCHVCGYRYDTKHSLDVHVKVHFRDEHFACHICGEKFKSKNAYRNHVLSMHEGIKPFKCDICGEAFIFKHTMLIHRKTHGNQFYICGYCNKKFKSPHYLKTHCAIHEGKSPFKCSSCNFATTSKAMLKKHTSTHDETLNLISCTNCNFVTMCNTEMDKHMSLHHNNVFEPGKMVFIMENPQ